MYFLFRIGLTKLNGVDEILKQYKRRVKSIYDFIYIESLRLGLLYTVLCKDKKKKFDLNLNEENLAEQKSKYCDRIKEILKARNGTNLKKAESEMDVMTGILAKPVVIRKDWANIDVSDDLESSPRSVDSQSSVDSPQPTESIIVRNRSDDDAENENIGSPAQMVISKKNLYVTPQRTIKAPRKEMPAPKKHRGKYMSESTPAEPKRSGKNMRMLKLSLIHI